MLIKTKENFHHFTGLVSLNKAFESYRPSIEWAMNFHMIPLLGEKLYNKLEDDLFSDGSGSPSSSDSEVNNSALYLKLQQKCLLAEACYAAFDFAQISDVHITAQGLQAINTDTHKSAYEYQKRDVRNYFAEKADIAIDDVLLFLEKNYTVFTEWSNDEELFTKSAEFIINDVASFNRYCDIGNSRRTWLNLRYAMRDVVSLHIIPAIGSVIYETILNQVKSRQPVTGKMVPLYDYLKAAFANLTIAEALPDMTVRISGERISIASFFSPGEKMSDQYIALKENITRRRLDKGKSYLDAAVRFIKQNPDDFTDFPYHGSEADAFILQNDPDSKHFVSPFL